MTKGVLDYLGMQFDSRSSQNRPAFRSKTGKTWFLDPGDVDFSALKPGKLLVEWDNFIAQSATAEIASSGGGKNRGGGDDHTPGLYGVLKSAIEAGKVTSPSDMSRWVFAAHRAVKGAIEGDAQNNPAQPPVDYDTNESAF